MSVRKRKSKNVDEETKASLVQHHLPYELWMMREALYAARQGAESRFKQNLQVEGLAIHARNVIDFLKNAQTCGFNPTDFTAKNFSVNRRFIRPELAELINHQISHLTARRTENQNEKFDEPKWVEATEAIEKEFKRWSDNLTPDWAEKWEQRQMMGEAAQPGLAVPARFNGACTAPTFSSTYVGGPTGPAAPPMPMPMPKR
jgi:hypothetical protein